MESSGKLQNVSSPSGMKFYFLLGIYEINKRIKNSSPTASGNSTLRVWLLKGFFGSSWLYDEVVFNMRRRCKWKLLEKLGQLLSL